MGQCSWEGLAQRSMGMHTCSLIPSAPELVLVLGWVGGGTGAGSCHLGRHGLSDVQWLTGVEVLRRLRHCLVKACSEQ